MDLIGTDAASFVDNRQALASACMDTSVWCFKMRYIVHSLTHLGLPSVFATPGMGSSKCALDTKKNSVIEIACTITIRTCGLLSHKPYIFLRIHEECSY